MKKIILTAAAAIFAAAAANAQYFKTTEVGSANGWTAYTVDNKSLICGYNDDRTAITIYNADFTVNKVVNIVEGNSVTSVGNAMLTQTLFNDDPAFEYVVYESSDDQGNMTFGVYNDEGTKLGTIPTANLMEVEGIPYLVKAIYNDSGIPQQFIFYKIERSNSANSMKVAPVFRVYPNPARLGETIRFELGNGAADVNVYDTDGTEKIRKATDADGNVQVDASSLGAGVHPYQATDADGKVHTGKIVVK